MSKKFRCPHCGEAIITQYLRIGEKTNCSKCGADIIVPDDAIDTVEKPKQSEILILKEKYEKKTSLAENNNNKLRALIEIAKCTGWVVFIYFCFMVLRSILAITLPEWIDAFIVYFNYIIGAFTFLILMLIIAESIKVFLAIEENTRGALSILVKNITDEDKPE